MPRDPDAFVRERLARAGVVIVERDVQMLGASLHVLTDWQRIVAELAREADEPVLGFSVD